MEVRVLIVEDEALIALHIEQLVEGEGHRVIGIALDPEEAREIAAEHLPHLAFVDLRLRNGTCGLDAVRYLREEHDAPSILVTANLDRECLTTAGPSRPVAFVGKPFYPAEITAAIQTALETIAR